jgi:hypothetical protein
MKMCLFAGSGLLLMACAGPALAQDGSAPEDDMPWSLSLDGGISGSGGDFGSHSYGLGLTRSIGDGYVSVSASADRSHDDGIEGVLTAAPSRSDRITLSGGKSAGPISVDLYGSLGWTRFEVARLNHRTGRTLSLDGDGKMMSVGGSLSYGKGLDLHTSLSASVSLSWDRSDTARVLVGPLGNAIIREERQSGITGNASVALSRTFGEGDRHAFGLNAGIVATDNAAASTSSIRRRGAARVLRPRPGFASNDTWNEFGASLGLGLTDRLSLDFGAMRTMGMKGPESNSLSSGLSFAF